MIFIPGWITNILLLATAFLAVLQLRRLLRPNPATTVQLWVAILCLVMILVVTFTGRRDPWLSLGFFAVAVACLLLIIRQHRYLPPVRSRP